MVRTLACRIMLVGLASGTAGAGIIYVDDDAPPGGNGQTWPTAYRFLQDGLSTAVAGDEIRVAGGTYKPDRDESHPTGTGDRTATFQLKNGVVLAGGYAGLADLNDPDRRDFESYESVLTGDLLGNDGANFTNYGENSYHVVDGSNTDATAAISGFTVAHGNANGQTRPHYWGSALLLLAGSPSVSHCSFVAHTSTGSAAVYLDAPGILLHLEFCAFADNENMGYSAALGLCRGSAEAIGCTFTGNVSNAGSAVFCGISAESTSITMIGCTIVANTHVYGGAVQASNRSSVVLENCLLSGNSATGTGQWGFGGGAAALGRYASISLLNCSLAGNRGTNRGGGLACTGGAVGDVRNCLFWGNSAPAGPQIAIGGYGEAGSVLSIAYSDAEGGQAGVYVAGGNTLNWGAGNIDGDPLFADPNNGDYHILPGSPCINSGDPQSFGIEEVDIDGEPRVMGGRVDMGVDEFTARPFVFGDMNCDGIRDFGDINPFVLALSNPASYAATYPDCEILNGDINGDGELNFGDINPFVELLSGGF